jgi:hypothetical protein
MADIFRGQPRKWSGGRQKNIHLQKIIYRDEHPKVTKRLPYDTHLYKSIFKDGYLKIPVSENHY